MEASRAGHKHRWSGVAYVVCLFCLVAIAGATGRVLRYERRGVERSQRDDAELRAGVNVELTQYDDDELDTALSDIASLGFRWVRQRFPWRAIEPHPGVYNWERWDLVVDAVRQHQLGLIAVLDAPPEWATAGPGSVPLPCVPPCDERAYARFAEAVARRYGETIDHYQVWDEPNLSERWGGGHVAPCGYAVLLEAAYGAIHAADPTSWVLGGALAPTQAPGPANLNDIAYLRQLYALGGNAHFDILAVKSYGFWSGPKDRRVEPDVLNFSRVIALRELQRSRSDSRKPVWAVEWGWNVLPDEWAGDPAPWGSDSLSVQQSRIHGAFSRVRTEWPWMEVMCWAAYQPDALSTDPHWGFALRDADGSPSSLYDVVGLTVGAAAGVPIGLTTAARPGRVVVVLLTVAVLDVILLWSRFGYGGLVRDMVDRLWHRWISLRMAYHLVALLVLAALYGVTPWPEWMLLELLLAAFLLYGYPQWALVGAAATIPFVYAAKPIGRMSIAPSETLLLLAWMVTVGRCLVVWRRPSLNGGVRALDAAWVLWVGLGVLPALGAPDPALAWQEWRQCMLGPLMLYLMLRIQKDPPLQVIWAWVMSGVVVALVGVGQFAAATLSSVSVLVPAGRIGRATGVYYSPNHLALYLERVWPVPLALTACGRLGQRWKRGAWGAVILMGAALYLTFSRGAWVLGIPAALCAVGWLCLRPPRWRVMVSVGAGLLLAATSIVYGRVAPEAEQLRIPVWESTLAMIADHPWPGVGLGGFRLVYPRYMKAEAWAEPLLWHPHNMWLDAGVKLGLPGLAGFALLVVLCLRATGSRLRAGSLLDRAVAIGFLAGLVAGLAHGMVDSGYFLTDLAWSLALVAGVTARGRAST